MICRMAISPSSEHASRNRKSLIPSYGGFYIDNNLYKGDKPEILIFCYDSKQFVKNVTDSLSPEFRSRQVYDMYKFYTSKDLGRHRAVITLPYSVMSYRTTELYALGIPIFAPSIKFYLNYYVPKSNESAQDGALSMTGDLGIGWDRTSTSMPYCHKDPDLETKMRPKGEGVKSIHPYSPNVDMWKDAESESYWLQFADFYDWPHIQYFDNYQHLKSLLTNSKFTDIHQSMVKELSVRKHEVTTEWCNVINRIGQTKRSKQEPT